MLIAAFVLSSLLHGPVYAADQAADPAMSKSQVKVLKSAISLAKKGQFAAARRQAERVKSTLGLEIIRWMWLSAPESNAPFETVAKFIAEKPDWPSQRILRRRAEEAMPAAIPDIRVLAWFQERAPVSVDGRMRLAAALLATDKKEKAQEIIRKAWIFGNFGSVQERQFYRQFRKLLTRDDHIQRLDRLTWQAKTRPARRMYRRVNKDFRALSEARLALRRMRGGVDGAINRVPDHLKDHQGLIYERLRWRRRKGRDLDARELLQNLPDNLIEPKRWWRERSILSRRALQDGHISEAYELAQNHGLKSGGPYVDAEWLAGWIALRFLKDFDDAYSHFTEVYRVSQYPISRARGAYWAGRAAELQQDAKRARFWYRTAAVHPTTFYGQLATAQFKPETGFNVAEPTAIDPADVAEFDKHEVVRAVRLLAALGERRVAAQFIRGLAEVNRSPGWITNVAKLARESGRADIGISIAKKASREGAILGFTGYPTVPATSRKGLETPLLFALIRQESAFNQRAISHAGARGLMQLMPATARQVARRISAPYIPKRLIEDPAYNISIGQAYLQELLENFEGSYILSLAAYNAGPSRVRRWIKTYGDPRHESTDAIDWIEMIPFSETRNYVQRVIENLHVYRKQLNPSRLAFNPESDLTR